SLVADRSAYVVMYAAVALPPDDDPDRLGGLIADGPQPMRRGGIERDRVARAQVVTLEADLHAEAAAGDVAVPDAAVAHERGLRARLAADVVDDAEELDARVRGGRQPLPRHARGEPDHGALVDADERARVQVGAPRALAVREQVAHPEAELADDV